MRYVAACCLLLILVLSACGRSAAPAPTTHLTARLRIEAPRNARVGEPLEVTVRTDEEVLDGTPALLLLSSGISEQVVSGTFRNGAALLTIPAEQMTHAGALTLTVRSGAAHGRSSLTVLAGAPQSPLLLLVGPRAFIVGQEQHNMAIVVANDAFGNAVTNGAVEVRAHYADERVTFDRLFIHQLVAWHWLESTDRAGRVNLAARLDEASSPENSVDAVAGMVQPFSISADPATTEADGRQLVRLLSSEIHDAAGNLVPNGVYVEYVVTSAGGNVRRIPTQTINGVAEAVLQAPLLTDTLVIYAVLAEVQSAPLEITFQNASLSGNAPLRVQLDAAGQALRLTFGPITGALGQLVADGTPVRFSLTDPLGNREWIEALADGGYADIEVRMINLRVGKYTVEAFSGSLHTRTSFFVPK